MEIIKSLDQLREMIEKPRQFLGITFGLNKEECVVLLRRIHASMPEAIKEAEKLVRESSRIVETATEEAQRTLERAKSEAQRITDAAQKEAERELQQARLEREKLLEENEIIRAAKIEAERVRSEAEADAARMRRSADDYALDVLTRLEAALGKAMSNVERGKAELQRTKEPAGVARSK